MLNLLLEVSEPMTGSGANNRDVKKINRIRTIRSIFSCDRISQPELAAKVNNSWPTVLQNVKELMAMGLVQEVGTFESTGGRKARAFAPVRNARLAVGLEITQNHVGAVLVDLSGNLLHYERKKRLYERSDIYAEMLAGIVQGLIEKEGCPVEKILGVGISLPGILDKEGQTLVYSHALGLRNVPTEEFSRYIPFSCRFINDANAAGLAEVRDLESPRSLVYLSLSNSVGGAILTGGALYGGDHLRAGEFGHNTLVPDGRPCYCGKKGCLDAYCSAKVLSQLTDGNLALFFDGLRSGNAALQTAWNEYLSYLAFVQLDSKGDRSFTFYRNPGADVMLTSAEVNRNLIDDAAIFHFGSVSLTADPSRTATLEAARYARQQGKLVSFDPNYRPLLWEHPADAVVQMQEGVKLADLLKVSEEEMQLITNESDLARGSQALLEMGPSLVLVSLGAKGAYYRNAVGAGHLPTYDVPTVDTTGAGDAFMGAIHYQLRRKAAEDLRTLPAFELEEIVRFGNAAGSLTTTKGGAIPAMPSMVEIQNCIASIPLM